MFAKTNENGGVSIANTQLDDTWVEVTNFHPSDRMFRGAYKLSGTEIVEDLAQAKEIAHDKRRAKRDELFAPYDAIISKQVPGQNAQLAEQSRADIRNDDALVQQVIDSATDTDKIREALVAYNAVD